MGSAQLPQTPGMGRDAGVSEVFADSEGNF